MNKKLQSLILSGVLAVSMISKPIFASNDIGGEVTPIMEDAEVTAESEATSDETVPPNETTPDETVPVEEVEETVQYIGKLDISNIFEKIDTNNNYLGEFAISSINGITIKYANVSSYTLSAEELTYTNLNSWITINLENHFIELESDTCIIIEYTDDEGNLYKTEVPTSQLQSIEIYNEEKGYHLVASEMLLAIVEAQNPVESEEHADGEETDPTSVPDEQQTEEPQPMLFSTRAATITRQELAYDLREVDDYMIYAETVKLNSDHEGNIAANEVTIHSVLGNTSNVKPDINIDNFNYIEHLIIPGGINVRDGATILVGKDKNTITDEDNGKAYGINGHKAGMKDKITVGYIINDKNIEGELDKLTPTVNKLSQLESNTIIDQISSNSYNITPIENSDEFTVIKLKASDLRSQVQYNIITEKNEDNTIKAKNIIILVETDGSDLDINAKFEVDGQKSNWNSISSKILWNFSDSSGKAFTGKLTINDLMMGSFLAPEAQVYLQGGPFNGSIFCKDFLGNNNEVHKVDFEVEGVPKPEEPKEEIEEIDINLTPGTGDISVCGILYYPVFALAILVATNKKNNKN